MVSFRRWSSRSSAPERAANGAFGLFHATRARQSWTRGSPGGRKREVSSREREERRNWPGTTSVLVAGADALVAASPPSADSSRLTVCGAFRPLAPRSSISSSEPNGVSVAMRAAVIGSTSSPLLAIALKYVRRSGARERTKKSPAPVEPPSWKSLVASKSGMGMLRPPGAPSVISPSRRATLGW